ncbi:HAMP domain-containing sensor histidine kinase [Flavobacterium sp.]|uniref:sensor histidine kinase n=1 Tax=Flavobacterium sp. TaxID=239 RepID=UPI002486F34F|nr:HAMP domain-containing sensor histidine kinase [Flavobacterium sp.]MDI1316000.1 HAMP domain-containing sensor histidine kinase [Flavobacterium sp.]
MKQKINLLIGFSTLVLLMLIAIQIYLVKTTYDYKVEQFHSEVKDKIGTITNNYTELDSSIFCKKDILYKGLLEKFINDEDYRNQIKEDLRSNQYRNALTLRLQQKLKRAFPKNEVNFTVITTKFVVYNVAKTDTLFSEKPSIENAIYGNLTSLDNAFQVRSYVGTTSGFQNSDYKLLTEDTLYVSVADWEQIILGRMAILLILSIVSMVILISLFVIAIKALIQQKKVSDVKTDFINNITHELKTPLTTLSVSTKLLERKEVKDNEVVFNSILDTVNRQNARLQNIIDQVVYNSLGYDEIQLQKETIKTNALLKTIIADFNLAYPKVPIQTQFTTDETNLSLDKFHLTTALNNVLENAVKYGCQNITIVTSHVNNEFHISIQDDGIGIPKNKHSLLFEKFYRVEQGNIHNTKGLGLGLYYVDQIIKAHQGSIQVVSEMGKGASFVIRIPSV